MAQPKVSVIVPIYNTSKYLEQTLDSLVDQTMEEAEFLCVNDCSTDNSKEIIERFASKDPRIRLIDLPENRGEGLARKAGILASEGEYIMFLDGDDYLKPNACRDAYEKIVKEKVDIIHFGTEIILSSDKVSADELEGMRSFLELHNETLRYTKPGEMIKACVELGYFGWSVWNKIYCGDIVRKAIDYYAEERFDLAADAYLFCLIAMFSQSYCPLKENLYCYRFGAGITGGKPITNRVIENEIRQGRIHQLLKEFCAQFDLNGITDKSMNKFEHLFLTAVVWHLFHATEQPNWRRLIPLALTCFSNSKFLGELISEYSCFNYEMKSAVLEAFRSSGAFEAEKKDVKTVATFYHRMYDGGVERVLSKLIPMWTEMGYRVILFTDEEPSPEDYDYGENITRIVLPTVTKGRSEEYSKRIVFLQDMLTFHHVDLMVYHAWGGSCLEVDLLATKAMRIPFVVHTHNFFACNLRTAWRPGAIHNLLLQKVYELADGVITLSEMDQCWWALNHPRVYKTLNPATFDLEEVGSVIGRKSESGHYNILWLARISPEKQPFESLRVLDAVLRSGVNATLHIVGTAETEEYEQQLKDEIERLNLSENIVLHGFQSDVAKFYQNSDLFLFTSEFEGAPMTLVECLSFGLPVVMYSLPNLDLARNNPAVTVVPQHDASAAAAAIADILTNDEKREEMSRAARRSVEEAYSVNLPELWKQIFEEVGQQREHETSLNRERLGAGARMLYDFTAEGIELRGGLEPSQYKDVMLQMCKTGDLGIRYVFKFAAACVAYWFKKLIHKV